MQEAFENLKCKLIGVSTDSRVNVLQWLASMQELLGEHDAGGGFKLPMIMGESMDISLKYGMVRITEGCAHPVRALYIIDPQDRIRAAFFYPFENGRNFDEVKRTLEAIQKTDRFNVLTPDNWHPGDDLLLITGQNAKEQRMLDRKENKGFVECSSDYHYCIRSSRH